MKTRNFLFFATLICCFCSMKCEWEDLHIKCDPEKEFLESQNCPVNSKCVELGRASCGICACMFNFTVNKKYLSSDPNRSQYCLDMLQSTTIHPITTAESTSTTEFITTIEPLMTQETPSKKHQNKESKVYYNPIGIIVTVSMICVLTYALYRVIKANHHVKEWTQKKQVINELPLIDRA